MKRILTLLFISAFLMVSNNAFAQQDFNLSHYAFNKLLINPAVAGGSGKFCFSGISKIEWRNMRDETFQYTSGEVNKDAETFRIGQETFAGTFSAPIARSEKYPGFSYGGVGVSFFMDNAAYLTTTSAKISLAGRIPLSNGNSTLGIGVDIGGLQMELDGDRLKAKDPNDPNIPTDKPNDLGMGLSAGIYYTNSNLNDLYVGLSATRLNEPELAFGTGSLIKVKNERHYYLVTGMKIKDITSDIDIHPSILVKYNSKVQVDFTAIAKYQDKYYGGLGYRTSTAATYLMLGTQVNPKLRIGYSTDFSLTALRKAGFLTHEIQLNYCFDVKKRLPKMEIKILETRKGEETLDSD